MTPTKRRKCQTNTVCGGFGRAVWWYWVDGFTPHFIEKREPKPDRYATLICGACKDAIMLRYEIKKAQGDYSAK